MKSYAKLLTKNDTGETGGHQAGIAIPKTDQQLLSFFPQLIATAFNPDAQLFCKDPDGEVWEMRYIYYNGKTFSPPRSTRNEYRITHMTKFFAKWDAKAGDRVVFEATGNPFKFNIRIEKAATQIQDKAATSAKKPVVLRGWTKVY